MPGLQTEVRPFLAAMDIYMMSSVFEGLPIALLEAMSMGCAIDTTDAGGIKEVIRHGTDGLLCGVDEPEKLVDFVAELSMDAAKRKALGIQARNRIEECFSMESMVRELEKSYLKLLT
jgi:glycosyltransferase involved in cell wall biosynthesis